MIMLTNSRTYKKYITTCYLYKIFHVYPILYCTKFMLELADIDSRPHRISHIPHKLDELINYYRPLYSQYCRVGNDDCTGAHTYL